MLGHEVTDHTEGDCDDDVTEMIVSCICPKQGDDQNWTYYKLWANEC